MSQENVEIVRATFDRKPRAAILGAAMGRHLDERLALRAPRLYRRLVKLVLSLPPGSPVRRRLVKWLVARGWGAQSRQDDELLLVIGYDPNVELNMIGDKFLVLGFAERYHGHEGYREFLRLWRAEWSDVRYKPEALIDFGDRLVMRVTTTARGASSGAEVTLTAGYALWTADGAVVRQDFYWDWSACVEALGLSDQAAHADS
jgi:ketosteroid isomerase-like protein